MAFKSVFYNDLVCDHCGNIYRNDNRSEDNILVNKAISNEWSQDNNGKIYCPKCLEKKITLEIKFYWVNFFRMACVEQSIKNSGGNNPIQYIEIDEDNLHVIIDKDKIDNFAQTNWKWTLNGDLSDWQKTCSKFTIIYPDKEIILKKLICQEVQSYNDVEEFIFTFESKEEKIF